MKTIPARPRRGLAAIAGLLFLTAAAHGQTSLSFDFESPAFSTGSIMGQQGWSAGANGNTLIADGTSNVTSETIASGQAHSGTQSWQYNHGIDDGYSYGKGTPFSPNLSTNLGVGYQFSGTLYFKAASFGDGSYLTVMTGNAAGDDRAEILAYLNNNEGNFSVTVPTINEDHTAFIEVTVAQNLDDGWHRLDFSVTRLGTDLNSVRAMIDGSDLMSTTVEGAMGFYRSPENENTPYEESTRMKFNASLAGAGFYLDDISYTITAPVPEPATYAALLGGAVLLGAFIRRRKMAA